MKIYSIGTATLDIYFIFDDLRFYFKNISEKNDVKEYFADIGGGGLNFAYNFLKLNLDSTAIIKLGNDFISKFIKKVIEEKKIKSHIIYTRGNSSLSFIFLDKLGNKYIFTHRGDEIFKLKEIPITQNNVYYVSTGQTSPQKWLKVFHLLKQNKNFIGVNPSKNFLFNLRGLKYFDFIDFLNINFYEANLMIKYRVTNENKLNFLRTFRRKLNWIKYILITEDKNGSWLLTQDKIYHCETYKKLKIVDTTGAGDCFGSTFLGLLVKNNFDNSENKLKLYLKYATINTAFNLSKIGAQTGIIPLNKLEKYKNEKLKIKIFSL
ncbi:MAG: hypothetical protein KatS3mg094_186 [Candidatus Parcubacteria bacterium]|nr:MAG: hypothetical protein KatS3mg094_186 [Candidatus Parcubacteria bacterium]